MNLADIIVVDDTAIWLVAWAVFGLVGLFLGMPKNRAGLGLAFGFLFGPIGWIIIGCSKPHEEGEPDGLMPVLLLLIVLVVGGGFLVGRELESRRREDDRRRQIAEQNQAAQRRQAEEVRAQQIEAAAPKKAAAYVPFMTPAPIVVPRKPTVAEENAEIARKYGTR